MERNKHPYTREDLIKCCRYYKDEKENPFNGGDEERFWFYESIWVEHTLLQDGFFDYCVDDYVADGLIDFNKDDGVPLTLKAVIYNRYQHWLGGYGLEIDRNGFKEFYGKSYLAK
ncbi:MAG: hypothetical protein NC324_00055 [Bacteroides sp.]|nr:hypothetical protein [Bacteroides sp.]